MARLEFAAKDPEEIVTLTFDFSLDLNLSETIASPVTTVELVRGVDPAFAAVQNGAGQVSGSSILQSVKAGIAGCEYRVKVKVTTSAGRVLVLSRVLPVRDIGLA